jgi:hypothetical protein
MSESGTHLLAELQSASRLTESGGTKPIGTQCAPGQEHAGNAVGSITGGPWCGTHAPASPSTLAASTTSEASASAPVGAIESGVRMARMDTGAASSKK